MQRYLLFDSGCAMCTGLAQAVEQETSGWLTARSLRDQEMQALLHEAKPDWGFEPTLLEVKSKRARAYTGAGMRAHLALTLGPRKALRIAQLVRHYTRPTTSRSEGTDRRGFLRGASAVAGGLFLAGVGMRSGGALAASQDGTDIHQLEGPDAQPYIGRAQANGGMQKLQDYFQRRGYTARPDQTVVLAGTVQDSAGGAHDAVRVMLSFDGANIAARAGQTVAFAFYLLIDDAEQPVTGTAVANGNKRIDVFTYALRDNGRGIVETRSDKSFADLVDESQRRRGSAGGAATGGARPHLRPHVQPRYTCSHSCDLGCVFNCVTSFGCSPVAVVGCISSCLACPETGFACFACGFCGGYCGGAIPTCVRCCCG